MKMAAVLVFDADDTLWQNNIFFERVVDDFLAWVAHPTLDEAAIRAVLHDIEAVNVQRYGYGSKVFLQNLHDLFERLSQRPASGAERDAITSLASAVVDHRIELMPEVVATLDDLGRRHDLALLTKGAPDEQQAKIDASGLAGHFASLHIVTEKNPDTYRALATELGLDPATTWMIGNSPRSDIVAARLAGWRAVFIPHPATWSHEEAELDLTDPGILQLARFAELPLHF